MMSSEADTEAWFFADGSCKWIDTTYYGGVEKTSEYDGWVWTVAGSDIPEWDAPWIVQFRPGPNATAPSFTTLDEPDFEAKTLRVIAIDGNGFTAYREIEGHDIYLEMTRIP